ncbi:MrcB family domain-containing protein [Sphingobium yanoikuyae]|uniref:MrcB family domain-containing protein n=1 Tax=Sphingobium yanoikuyae TaxID=13690 RepID=UPI0009B68D5C|nr:DUF3578 domain-containing protein [Sphingobium yanoikuyae]
MIIRDCIETVLDGYIAATSDTFSKHPLANFMRRDFPAAVRAALIEHDLILVKGSAGQGNWARGPWIGIYNRLVTENAVRGYYPAYLFREDLEGVYLSLNQGMTEAKESYKSDAKSALRARAGDFRAKLGSDIGPFNIDPIDLAPSSKSNDTAFYEAANVCSIYYERGSIPSEEVLQHHLRSMISLYDRLINSDAVAEDLSPDTAPGLFMEGGKVAKKHIRIERNRALVNEVKKRKGCQCEACGFSFSSKYSSIGDSFIEAHHKVPIASLRDNKVALDPDNDFVVLCANCHRMIHRMPDVSDVDALRALILESSPA